MKIAAHCLLLVVTGSLLAGGEALVGLRGRYVGVERPDMVLTLEEAADGVVTGALAEGGASFVVTGKRAESGFSGTATLAGDTLPVAAVFLKKDKLILQLGPPDGRETIVFKREALAAAAGPKAAPATGQRHVIINGKRLSDAEVAQVEKTYRVRMRDADFWYDKVLGAWGIRGGPTTGFILPGLDLGGAPLPSDASGGNTKVFINGRELPPADLLALQKVTGPVVPGRYFITAQGLAGFEGGPPLWNLAALAAKGDNPSNSWSSKITGASGFSDGTTSAIFFGDGTSVSTGN